MKLAIITDAKNLGRAIGSIASRGKKLDSDIHLAAVSCMYHAQQHGDTTLTARLVNAMPRSGRRMALCAWYEAFAPMTIDRKSGKVTLSKGRTVEQFKVEEASEVPFWDFTEETEPKEFTLDSLKRFLDRTAKGGTEKQPASDEAKQAALKALAAINGSKRIKPASDETKAA